MDPVVTVLRAGAVEIPIASYGLCLALGLLIGAAMVTRAAHRAALDAGRVIGVLGFTAVGGLFGAWLFAVAVATVQTGDALLAVQRGGFVFYGALLGAAVVFFTSARALSVPGRHLADLAVPGIAIAHGLGRIGCFLAGCCYGSASGAPWAVVYRHAAAPASIEAIARHPTPLYEAGLLFALALFFALRPLPHARPGHRFGLYWIVYGALRFGLEYLRGDEVRGFIGPLSTSQVISVAAVLAATAFLERDRRIAPAIASLLLWLSVAAPGVGAGQVRLRAPLNPRAHVPRGWFDRGSYDEEILEARSLCMRHALDSQAILCDESRFEAERPRQRVWVSSFAIDRTEVTRARYDECVAARRCVPGQGLSEDVDGHNLPVTHVTHRDAKAFCAFAGGRLPTEAEWERAARGHDGRAFPWGRAFNERLANHGTIEGRADDRDGYRAAAPVGSFPDGASPYGVLDLAGNVWEWTADALTPYADITPRVDPNVARRDALVVVRGGSWLTPPFALRAAFREALPPNTARPDVGFRCAY